MELLYSLSPNWEPIPDLTKRWSRKPDADEVADAESSYSHWIERVVSGRWGHGSLDEDVPEAHSYYLVSEPEVTQSTLRIYYRHWEWGNPITERVSKPAADEGDAKAIFDAFMREKSLALIDFELRDKEYLQLSAEIHELELEEHSSLTFELVMSPDTGCRFRGTLSMAVSTFFAAGIASRNPGKNCHLNQWIWNSQQQTLIMIFVSAPMRKNTFWSFAAQTRPTNSE